MVKLISKLDNSLKKVYCAQKIKNFIQTDESTKYDELKLLILTNFIVLVPILKSDFNLHILSNI